MDKRIKELAEQAGLEELSDGDWCSLNHPDVRANHLERFAELVRDDERAKCAADYLQDCCDAVDSARLKEREACAQLCDDEGRVVPYEILNKQCYRLADLIRARGNHGQD
jgi:hypothetical protein